MVISGMAQVRGVGGGYLARRGSDAVAGGSEHLPLALLLLAPRRQDQAGDDDGARIGYSQSCMVFFAGARRRRTSTRCYISLGKRAIAWLSIPGEHSAVLENTG